MTITLDLPKDLEDELSAEAARFGLPLQEYALRVLTTGRKSTAMPTTGPELVNYWRREGLIGTLPDITDSQRYARELRCQADQRVRE